MFPEDIVKENSGMKKVRLSQVSFLVWDEALMN